MKWVGHKLIKASSVRMDVADIRRRMKEPNVIAMAESIARYGGEPMQSPTVRAESLTLIAGRDRMAALAILKAKKVTIRLVDCTDAEAAELEIVENAHRRGEDRTALLAKLAEMREAALTEEAKGGSDTPLQAASKQTIRAVARKQAAQIAGVSPERVKKAQAAVKKDSAHASEAPTPPSRAAEDAAPEPLLPANIDTLGLPWEEGPTYVAGEACAEAQAIIDAVDRLLRQAQGMMKRVPELHEGLRQELYADLHRVADRIRAAKPASLCPWCKGLAQQIKVCGGCHGARFVTAEKAKNAPRELREGIDGLPVVAVNGAYYEYAVVAAHPGAYHPPGKDWRNDHAAQDRGEKARAGRRITIELADGERFVPPSEGPYSDDDDGTPIAPDDEENVA